MGWFNGLVGFCGFFWRSEKVVGFSWGDGGEGGMERILWSDLRRRNWLEFFKEN